jgi:hypothetical protein
MIKSYVLGCLGAESEASLKSFMEDAEKFPWKELGQYQNLAALIPVNLTIETPDSAVKEKIIKMLYELKEAAEAPQKISEFSSGETLITEDDFQLEELKTEENLSLTSGLNLYNEEPLPDLIEDTAQLKDVYDYSGKTGITTDERVPDEETHTNRTVTKEKPERKSTPPAEEHKRGSKMKDIMDREDFEKRTKEYINTYYQKKFEDLQEETKKALYIAIAGVALATLAALLAIVL